MSEPSTPNDADNEHPMHGTNVSGGVNVDANEVNIGGDVVGRDKITIVGDPTRSITARLITVLVIQGVGYACSVGLFPSAVLTANPRAIPNLHTITNFFFICFPLLFGPYAIYSFVRGRQLGSRNIMVLSLLSGLSPAVFYILVLGFSAGYRFVASLAPTPTTAVSIGLYPIQEIETYAVPGLVLWDTSHGAYGQGSREYIPSEQYSEIMQALAQSGYQFQFDDRGVLNLDISKYSIVLLNVSAGAYLSPLSEDEAQRIKDYVTAGGGLILMGDNPCCEEFQHLDPIGSLMGIDLSNKPEVDGPTKFSPHPVTKGIQSLYFQDGGALAVSPPATAVAWTSSVPVVAVAEVGKGRVVAVGDVNVWHDGYLNQDNIAFAVNVFNWLSKRER